MTMILVADDSRSVREYCKRELESEGYYVIVARDGSEASRLASCFRPDVVILDLGMPGVDGLEAAASIRVTQPDVPVIFFTSFDDACIRKAADCCCSMYVQKREDLAELKAAVVASLNVRRDSVDSQPCADP